MAKIATQKVNPRELILLQSLEESNHIKHVLANHTAGIIKCCGIIGATPSKLRIQETIAKTLKEEAPVNTAKGNFIADGFSAELDDLRALLHSGKSHLDAMLERETEAHRHSLP